MEDDAQRQRDLRNKAIARRWQIGARGADIADDIGISRQQVWRVLRQQLGRVWRRTKVLTFRRAGHVLALSEMGHTIPEIAAEIEAPESTVRAILRRYRRKASPGRCRLCHAPVAPYSKLGLCPECYRQRRLAQMRASAKRQYAKLKQDPEKYRKKTKGNLERYYRLYRNKNTDRTT